MSDSIAVPVEIKAGTPVYLDNGVLVAHNPADWKTKIIGLARRNLTKGELIEYSPDVNTKDIVVFGSTRDF